MKKVTIKGRKEFEQEILNYIKSGDAICVNGVWLFICDAKVSKGEQTRFEIEFYYIRGDDEAMAWVGCDEVQYGIKNRDMIIKTK